MIRPIGLKRARCGRNSGHTTCLPPGRAGASTAAQAAARGGRIPGWGAMPAIHRGRNGMNLTTSRSAGMITDCVADAGTASVVQALAWQQGIPRASPGWQDDWTGSVWTTVAAMSVAVQCPAAAEAGRTASSKPASISIAANPRNRLCIQPRSYPAIRLTVSASSATFWRWFITSPDAEPCTGRCAPH